MSELIEEHHIASDYKIPMPNRVSKLVPGKTWRAHEDSDYYNCPRCENPMTLPHGVPDTCTRCGLWIVVHGNGMTIRGYVKSPSKWNKLKMFNNRYALSASNG